MSGPNKSIQDKLDEIESDEIREMWSEILFNILSDVSRTLRESERGTGEIEFTVREEAYQDMEHEKNGVLVMEAPFDVPWDEFDVVEEKE